MQTNHLDRIDPALLRPGRMDLRVEYKNANRQQIVDLFSRFYSQELMTQSTQSAQNSEAAKQAKTIVLSDEAAALVKRSDNSSFLSAVPTKEDVAKLAQAFADKVTENTYSIAQLQGFLLCSKRDPHGALHNIDEWLADREKEVADKAARLAKRALERAKWLKMENFRAKKSKQMELEADKELLEEAEKEEKDVAAVDGAEADPANATTPSAAETTPAAEPSPPSEDRSNSGESSDKDSEAVMVERVAA